MAKTVLLVYAKEPSWTASIPSFMLNLKRLSVFWCWSVLGVMVITGRFSLVEGSLQKLKYRGSVCLTVCPPRWEPGELSIHCVPFSPWLFLESPQLFSNILLLKPCADYNWVHTSLQKEVSGYIYVFSRLLLNNVKIWDFWAFGVWVSSNVKRIFLQRMSCCIFKW